MAGRIRSLPVLLITAIAVLASVSPIVILSWFNGEESDPAGAGGDRQASMGVDEPPAASPLRRDPVTGETGSETLERMNAQLSGAGEGRAGNGGSGVGGSSVDRFAGPDLLLDPADPTGPLIAPDDVLSLDRRSGLTPESRARAAAEAQQRAERERRALLLGHVAGPPLVATPGTRVIELEVERISQPAGATAVRGILQGVPGVREVSLNGSQGRAWVRVDQTNPMTAEQLAQRLTGAGYPATGPGGAN